MSKYYYGSSKTRRRAKQKLTAQEVKPGLWLVTGGEMGHGVVIDGDPPVYKCDCNGQEGAMDRMCSHCLAVWAQINGNQDFLKGAGANPGGRQ